jgi:uncharacterized membrane protein
MSAFMQWVHVSAAVIGVGGMGFLLFLLLPGTRVLAEDQRRLLLKNITGRFRWVSWAVILLLIGSGLYNVRAFYWEVAWGRAWRLLALKIVLAFGVFAAVLLVTLPGKFLERFRARRELWLSVAFWLAMAVILISAYLRRS